jgi:hypothetical protein
MLILVVQKGATDIMPTRIPTTSEERKRLLQSFFDLPSEDKQIFYKSVGHLRWLMVLWDLEELDQDSMPDVPEKRHILFAYKFLHIIWFDKVPERDNQAFTIYVRDRLPDDQSPERINGAFDRSMDELADLCRGMPRPKWLRDASAVKTSIEVFPQKSR